MLERQADADSDAVGVPAGQEYAHLLRQRLLKTGLDAGKEYAE